MIGVLAALVLRIAFALVVTQLMQVVGLIFIGGLLLIWVAWKMWRELREGAHSAGSPEVAGDEHSGLTPAKSFAADTAFMCAGNMIQLHGGIGFTWEHDAHLYFKRARALQSMLGAGDWHREQVATMILGAAA